MANYKESTSIRRHKTNKIKEAAQDITKQRNVALRNKDQKDALFSLNLFQ
jgi:hypothetical protein